MQEKIKWKNKCKFRVAKDRKGIQAVDGCDPSRTRGGEEAEFNLLIHASVLLRRPIGSEGNAWGGGGPINSR